MTRIAAAAFLCFFTLILNLTPAQGGHVIRDCRQWWMTYENNAYHPLSERESVGLIKSIYFHLPAHAYRGQYLQLSSNKEWSFFVNGQLLGTGFTRTFSIDSLSTLYSEELFIGVHAMEPLSNLRTSIVSEYSVPEIMPDKNERSPTFFRDFSILASAILLLFFLVLFRTNPQLTLDYFTFTKIFSVQERNENLLVSRITSSVNLLFYLFCALLTGFLLTNVFYFAGSYFWVGKQFTIDSMGHSFQAWLSLSLLVLALLAAKLLVVSLFSALFNFRESVSFQFFNFLRFVLFTAVLTTVLSLFYFIFGGEDQVFYQRMIVLALALLGIGSVMALIKLLPRAPFSFFHLFSYLCASEIIPLVIIIKIFF